MSGSWRPDWWLGDDLFKPGCFQMLQVCGLWSDDGLHGNNQISGEAQDVLWKLEECKVRIADQPTMTA
jgi:hypothetical protein